jgi:hypothetical protein
MAGTDRQLVGFRAADALAERAPPPADGPSDAVVDGAAR